MNLVVVVVVVVLVVVVVCTSEYFNSLSPCTEFPTDVKQQKEQ